MRWTATSVWYGKGSSPIYRPARCNPNDSISNSSGTIRERRRLGRFVAFSEMLTDLRSVQLFDKAQGSRDQSATARVASAMRNLPADRRFVGSTRAKSRSGRPKQNGPHPVDLHVGLCLREQRIQLGMSQPKLAAALGITYQQLYKYEHAKNRISASRPP